MYNGLEWKVRIMKEKRTKASLFFAEDNNIYVFVVLCFDEN